MKKPKQIILPKRDINRAITALSCILGTAAICLAGGYYIIGAREVPHTYTRSHSTKECPNSCTYVECQAVWCEDEGNTCVARTTCGNPIPGVCRKVLFWWVCEPSTK